MDCRVLPQIDLDRMVTTFHAVFGEIARQESMGLELSVVQRLQATTADARVVNALQAAIARVHGPRAHSPAWWAEARGRPFSASADCLWRQDTPTTIPPICPTS
jgi:acetylornithine deacetylase/succinyl-diaminopimelate desuccinylase-like protein